MLDFGLARPYISLRFKERGWEIALFKDAGVSIKELLSS
jgi:hypothetical protein